MPLSSALSAAPGNHWAPASPASLHARPRLRPHFSSSLAAEDERQPGAEAEDEGESTVALSSWGVRALYFFCTGAGRVRAYE